MASLFFSSIVKQYFIYHTLIIPHPTPTIYETRKTCLDWIFQGYNATKVISDVYPSFVLQCTVSARCNVNTRRITKPDMGSIFCIKNQWNILVLGNYYVNYVNYQNYQLSILVNKFRPEITGFNMYAEYTQLQLTFLSL